MHTALPGLTVEAGVGSAHLLEAAATPAMTREQRIRGADAGVDWVVLVSGYEAAALTRLADARLCIEMPAHGATDMVAAIYENQYALTADELRSGPRETARHADS
jgi:hypothetical protein